MVDLPLSRVMTDFGADLPPFKNSIFALICVVADLSQCTLPKTITAKLTAHNDSNCHKS
jgi:hypothetical protein